MAFTAPRIRLLLALIAGSCVLAAAIASGMNAAAPRPEPRWSSSFSPLDAGFSVDLPVRERRWMRPAELPAGLEGIQCRDAEKHAVYTVIFGTPEKPWSLEQARAFLGGEAAHARPLSRAGRDGLECATPGRRREILLDGSRVLVLAVDAPSRDVESERFFESLTFARR